LSADDKIRVATWMQGSVRSFHSSSYVRSYIISWVSLTFSLAW